MTFRAILIEKADAGVGCAVTTLEESQLPQGEVQVDVEYSTVNYKDGLVLQGLGNLVRSYPHVPGVDFAGVVSASASAAFKPGDRVVLTGWRVGETHWGGLAERASVKADWLLRLPDALSTRDAMAIGTAGLSAMLAVTELEAQGVAPSSGPVLVTGATGGVGTVATLALSLLGYEVHAVSGKPSKTDYLKGLGAREVLPRDAFSEPSNRPLEGARWAGCVDAVGGTTLARVLAQLDYGGVVAAVGLAGGAKLETTVIPFLLRGARLVGIDSVLCPNERRTQAWNRLAELDIARRIEHGIEEIALADAIDAGRRIIAGEIAGRVVVNVRADAGQ